MCIICISPKGVKQPSEKLIRTMFRNNPDGAGYMVANGETVRIEKGFMTVDDLLRSLRQEAFCADDAVVYHFRISTQAGVNPEMTQPFPYSGKLENMRKIETETQLGIAHNGIIPCTTDRNDHEYSDTARFITQYLTEIIECYADLKDQDVLDYLLRLTRSKLAFLDPYGRFYTVGHFIKKNGLLFSNSSYEVPRFTFADVDFDRLYRR